MVPSSPNGGIIIPQVGDDAAAAPAAADMSLRPPDRVFEFSKQHFDGFVAFQTILNVIVLGPHSARSVCAFSCYVESDSHSPHSLGCHGTSLYGVTVSAPSGLEMQIVFARFRWLPTRFVAAWAMFCAKSV